MEFRSEVTNKIVTDREIIRALEICDVHPKRCSLCAYFPNPLCMAALKSDTRTLVYRQRERIEALEFLEGHMLLSTIGKLEELIQWYGVSELSRGIQLAIDTIKKEAGVTQP